MIKKKKDFFESVLSDVSPLKRKRHIDLKKEEIKSTLKKKYYETEILAKTAISEEKEFIKTDQTKKIINDKSNFFKKLKRGKIRVDRKIDLHGLTLAQAEERFDTEIESSFNKKLRCMLFITGKGLRKKNNEEYPALYYGKIRNNIGKWVMKKQNEERVLYFSVAHSSHGGDGSFYAYLRKK